MLEKVTDRSFFAFWPFENEWKFRKNVKLMQKSEIWQKVNIIPPDTIGLCHCILRVPPPPHLILNTSTTTDTSTKPCYVRMYHYHTSYCADHQFPIINTNSFVIHRCEFYLCLNWTVLFICFMTEHENGTIFMNPNQLRIPQKKLQKNSRRSFLILGCMKKYSTIFIGICSVKRANEPIKHWKSSPVKYCFGW